MLIFRAASTPPSVSVMSSPLNVRLQSSDISFFTANQPAVYTAVFWLAQATRSARRWRAIYLRSLEEKVHKPLFRTETRTFGEKVRRPRGQTTYLIWCLIGCHNTADGLPEWLNKPLSASCRADCVCGVSHTAGGSWMLNVSLNVPAVCRSFQTFHFYRHFISTKTRHDLLKTSEYRSKFWWNTDLHVFI